MFQIIINFFYTFIAWSGIVLYMIPLMTYFARFMFKNKSNYILKDDKGKEIGMTKVNGKIYPPFGEKQILGIKKTIIRDTDVLLCGISKTGCHWVHEIMYMLKTGKAEMTKYGKEFGGMIDAMPPIIIDSLPSPRVLNTHVDYDDLPIEAKVKMTKIVLTVRHPKDTCVSYFNHLKSLKEYYNYDGDFQGFFPLYVDGSTEYGNYFDYYVKWDKVIKNQKDQPILVVRFEDLKSDPAAGVKRIAKFLDTPVSDGFVQQIVDATSFNTMKKKREGGVNSKLYRKGKVGDWRNWMTDEQSAKIERVSREKMAGCSEQFRY